MTLTQVPLVYLLATKRGPLNLLASLSYERINWIHRWAGRILFLSASTHMSIMMYSISITDIIRSPEKVMVIVRYGVGAYGTLTWIVLTSVLPLRRWSYRLFYANHWVSTLAFLWILFKHVPTYARIPIYSAVSIIAFDRCLSSYIFLRTNIAFRPVKRKFSKFRKNRNRKSLTMGHHVKMSTLNVGRTSSPFVSHLSNRSMDSVTIIRVCDTSSLWRPGQHVRLYLPKLGAFEMHPFTPATCSELSRVPVPPRKNRDVENEQLLSGPTNLTSNDMILFVQPCTGFTRRLFDYHSKWLALPCPNSSRPSSSLTAFIDGPYGTPPAWEEYENIVLVATSTGVSFLLSVVDFLEQMCLEGDERLRTKNIRFVWATRHIDSQLDVSVTELLLRRSLMLRESGIAMRVEFFTTCPASRAADNSMQDYDPFAHLRRPHRNLLSGKPLLRIYNPDEIYLQYEEEDSGTETGSMYESKLSSSVIDEEEEEEEGLLSKPKSPEQAPEVPEQPWWTRVPSFPRAPHRRALSKNSCNCSLIQCHRKQAKLESSNFINRIYSDRPQIDTIIYSSAPLTDRHKTMVAVCSNQELTSQAKNVVARMNFEFAAGRREGSIDMFSEGFG